MKVFLSHKMHGVPVEEVIELREKMMLYLTARFPGELIDIIDNYHHDDAPENAGRLWHLGRSIQMMEEAEKKFVKEKSKDFDYGDHYRTTKMFEIKES